MCEQDVHEQCSNWEVEPVYTVLHRGGLNADLTNTNSSFNWEEFPEVPPIFFNLHFVETIDIESR